MASSWIVLLVVLGAMSLVWLLSLALRDASVVDLVWGAGFAATAWLYYGLSGSPTGRGLLLAALVTLWGLRLSGHLIQRNRGRGEDYRYGAMRRHWGRRFPWVSLFTVFLFQGLLMWFLSLPFGVVHRPAAPGLWTPLDIVGLVLFSGGLLFEAVGDWQLTRFKADPSNRDRVLDRGLWRYTRHPNYFGDALVWWGFFLIVLSTPGAAWTIASPVVMTFFLVRVSGVPLLERKLVETSPGYREYVARTSSFFPWPPRDSSIP